jgi:hypothetical protein
MSHDTARHELIVRVNSPLCTANEGSNLYVTIGLLWYFEVALVFHQKITPITIR